MYVSRVGITLEMDKKARPNAKYMCIYCINLGRKDGCNIQLMWRAMSKNVFNRLCSAIRRWESIPRTAFIFYVKSCLEVIKED